jgi:alanine racemase
MGDNDKMVSQHEFSNADSLITIDLDAIVANWRYLDSLSPGTTLTAGVVKANAYGLGADKVAPSLAAAGCKLFFVMSLEEGISLRADLRAAGHEAIPIFCLSGCHAGQEPEFLHHGLSPVINDLTQIARLGMFAQRHDIRIPAALHIDTGMSRLGLNDDETDWLIEHSQDGANALEGIDLVYVMSHLASAEDPDSPSNKQQLDAFRALMPFFPNAKASLANSGGVLLGTDYQFNMTRPGIALYGEHPAGMMHRADQRTAAQKLRCAVTWDARILQLRQAKSGDAVGYGGTHVLTRDSLIATVGVGYADGYQRCLGGVATAMVAGHKVPVIGRVSMDSLALDVTDIPQNEIRTAVCARLLGEAYTAGMMANDAGTIGYEILTGLGRRPARRYLGDR